MESYVKEVNEINKNSVNVMSLFNCGCNHGISIQYITFNINTCY